MVSLAEKPDGLKDDFDWDEALEFWSNYDLDTPIPIVIVDSSQSEQPGAS